ncbi:OmpA family protein [Microbulbifer thermotolerans]|uniref:OmpA family protein n=1 Tax=Microbulbifer thermotolerans TaxID=252514 RepID=UPI00224B37F1|nr:OmpA family protein [Microbulbifer thermotolerans]MCX2778834.1 OmpA family protein [Microbulbifer thermotolerans]MCX2804139.1 OmpA family protein [Microbulbifer thermotolerans]MCX2841157.1 OmpA family protein [Microbulbifer thermotolerans]
MRFLFSLALSSSLTISLPSVAEGPDDTYFDLTPYIAHLDKDRKTDRQAGGLRAAYGWGWQGPWYSEVQVFGSILESNDFSHTYGYPSQTDYYMYGLGFDVVYNFGDRIGYTPYLLGGLGAVNNDVLPDEDDATNAFVNFAAGITTQEISQRGIRLRGEVRYMYDFFKDNMSDWQLAFGISIPLRRPPAPAVATVSPQDIAPIQEPEQQIDVKLADSDNDGVLDRDDRCPDTLPGAKVDSEGCVIANQVIILDNIHFEFNSSTLTPIAQNELLRVVLALRNQPGSEVEIAGHTDSLGNDNYNLRLSQSRADAVRAFLIQNGINTSRLTAIGYGEQQPIASNETESGRAQNRRVEIHFR